MRSRCLCARCVSPAVVAGAIESSKAASHGSPAVVHDCSQVVSATRIEKNSGFLCLVIDAFIEARYSALPVGESD